MSVLGLLLGFLGLAGGGRVNLALLLLVLFGSILWNTAALAPEGPPPAPFEAAPPPQELVA